jgi:hypothetical protein
MRCNRTVIFKYNMTPLVRGNYYPYNKVKAI